MKKILIAAVAVLSYFASFGAASINPEQVNSILHETSCHLGISMDAAIDLYENGDLVITEESNSFVVKDDGGMNILILETDQL